MSRSLPKILVCLGLAIFYLSGFSSLAADRGWIAVFGTADCEDCAAVKRQWREELTAPEDPALIFLDIAHAPNYRLLERIETALKIPAKGSSFPIFLVGNRLIASIDAFYELEDELFELAAAPPALAVTAPLAAAAAGATTPVVDLLCPEDSPADGASLTMAAATTATTAIATPQLLYFFQKNCQKCSRQEKELELLLADLPELTIARFDVATLDGLAILRRAMTRFRLPADSTRNLAPMLCWQDGFITGRLAAATELKQALSQYAEPYQPFWQQPVTDMERQAEKARQQRRLGWGAVGVIIGAGLIDGFNPCAFATSIFLLGYLLYLKRRPRDIALVGASFCLGVFLTYVLFGIGLSFLIDFLNRATWVKTITYGGLGILGILLAIGHLRDALRYRRSGKAGDMALGLDKKTHVRIHTWIKRLTDQKSWLMMPAALLLGAIVSAMELACTGQIYLPTLAAINADGIDLRAVLLLLLYNVFFILPLAVITTMTVMGVGAQPVAAWARKHVFATKIAMAILFACLAVLMFSLTDLPGRFLALLVDGLSHR